MRRVLVLALVLLVLNFFNACSIKPIYNNLDRLIVWQVGDYLDLNRDQKASLRTDLSVLLKWHRESHLILYADWLAELPNQYSDGVSAQMIEDLFDQMLVWGEEIENQAMPLMTDVLVSLNGSQIDHLESEFRGTNEEWVDVERGESLEDYQRGWSEEVEDAIERFTGRLNAEQLDYLKRKSVMYQPERVLWGEYRERWQRDFFVLLRSNKSADFANRFETLMKSREDYYGAEFSKVFESNLDLNREVAAYLLSNLTEKQTNKFNKTLSDLSKSFRELANG